MESDNFSGHYIITFAECICPTVVQFFRNSPLSIVKLYTPHDSVKLQQPTIFKLGLFGSINTERKF